MLNDIKIIVCYVIGFCVSFAVLSVGLLFAAGGILRLIAYVHKIN